MSLATHVPRCCALALACSLAVIARPAAARDVVQGAPDSGIRLGRTTAAPAIHVCIDSASSQAWTLLYSTADAKCAEPRMQRVPLAGFPDAATRRALRARILQDAFPDMDVLEQVKAWVAKFPAQPLGLTWDGGMAVTATDYSAAERRLEAWQAARR